MNEALGFLTEEERYTVFPYIAYIQKNFPDFLEWSETLDLQKQIQLCKMIVKDKEKFVKDTMFGFTQYAAFRDTPEQKTRRRAQEDNPRESREELMALNAQLAKQYGFDLQKMEIILTAKEPQ